MEEWGGIGGFGEWLGRYVYCVGIGWTEFGMLERVGIELRFGF